MSYQPHDAIVVNPGQDLAGVVNALPSNSRVYLGDGVHAITSTISINAKSNISIEGGPNATVRYTGAGTAISISGSSDITLKGFILESQSTGSFIVGNLDLVGACNRIKLLNLVFYRNSTPSGSGIYCGSGTTNDLLIRGCTFRGDLLRGIEVRNAGTIWNRTRIVNCRFESDDTTPVILAVYFDTSTVGNDVIFANNNVSTNAGFWMQGTNTSTRIIVRGNTFLGGGVAGVGGAVALYNVNDAVVSSNLCGSIGGNSIQAVDSTNVVFRGNTIRSGQGIGLYFERVTRGVIGGNTVYDTGRSGIAAFNSIHVSASIDIQVAGNDVDGGPNMGIDIRSGAQNIIIEGNNVFAAGLEGILVEVGGGGTFSQIVIANNQIRNNQANAAIEIQSGTSVDDIVIKGNLIENSWIEGIFIESAVRVVIADNAIGSTGGGTTGTPYGILFVSCTYVTISGNSINSVSPSIGCTTLSTDVVIEGNNCLGAGLAGVGSIDVIGNRVIIAGNVITPYTTTSCGISGTISNSVIRGNKITCGASATFVIGVTGTHNLMTDNELSGAGIGIRIQSGDDYAQIVGNKLIDQGGNGIDVRADDCLVAGNFVTGAGGDGIHLNTIVRVNVNGNYVEGSTGDGIDLVDVDESTINGNRCYNNGGYGINQDANSDQDLVSSNHVRGNVTGALNLLGTNLTNVNNKV